MATMKVNDVTIAYEVAGDGPSVVWTGGGAFPRNFYSYFYAGRMSTVCNVFIWDRRNCGQSDTKIEDAESEWHVWTDDLHALLEQLGMLPAYFAGASAGSVVSMLMAHRFPDDVKGLMLQDCVSEAGGALEGVVKRRYQIPADLAISEGMKAVVEADGWLKNAASSNEGNRERLLAMEPKRFATILRQWGDWFLTARGTFAHLSDSELKHVTVPTLIAHGFDPVHTEPRARVIYDALPNANWVQYSDNCTQKEMQELLDGVSNGTCGPSKPVSVIAPYHLAFIEQVELKEFVAR